MFVRRPLAFVGLLLAAAWWCCLSAAAAEARKPNVLMIAIDDLNAWVTHLGGHPQAKTPAIDRLAGKGVTMERAYCAAPVCNPSRTALLTGLRPSTSGVYDNGNDWRGALPDVVTLPLHFKQQGYYVAGAGKIYHGGFPRSTDWSEYFSEPHGDPKPKASVSDGVGGIKFAPLDCGDEDLVDYATVSWIIERLNENRDKPFFLACGLHKPHMPWNVPRKYYDMFPLSDIKLPKVLESDLDDIPAAGKRMANPQGDHAQMLAAGRWKEAVQAYLAAGAYTDMLVGRLIEAFEKSAARDNTIVLLWGDHGWHLGEKQHWRKFALWEEATRAPLVWVVPGVTKAGGVCKSPVDFMSIYPTLCELCSLPKPPHVEGLNIKPLLGNPQAEWKTPALTTHGFKNHAVRSAQWRYIRYADGSEELYDEERDPLEWTNLAGQSQHADVKQRLAAALPAKDQPEVASTAKPGKKAEGKAAKKRAKQAASNPVNK